MRASLFFGCLLLAVCGVLSSCKKRETRVQEGNRTGTLHYSIGSEPADLDPHTTTGLGEGKIVRALFEPLVNLDPKSYAPVPALAERWTVSPDGLTYTFHLREARWSNGDALTAQDCIDSWKRILTPSLAADYAYFFYLIRGAEEFHRGQAGFDAVGLAAPDTRTLVVTLAHPAPYFLQILGNMPWRPVHVRSIAQVGDATRRGTPWTRPGKIVTSGPFTLKEWTPHQRVVVEKSATYWDSSSVKLNGIVFYPTDSIDAEERAFRSGQLHVTWSVPLAKVDTYRREQPASLRIDPFLDTYFFRLNTRRAPLDDARVRRALSLAIDRELIATKVLKGGQRPAATLVPPAVPNYSAPERPTRDLATARRLLEEAGHAGGAGLPPIEILYNNSDILRLIAEAIQEMWRRDLGVEVRLVNQEYKVVFASRRAGDYQVLLGDWVGDYLDATTFLDLWQSQSGNNHTGWTSAEYDALLNRARATADASARAALLQQAESLLLDAAPIAPIYFNTHVYLLQPSVQGWQPSPMDDIDYRHVSLVP